MKMILSSNAYKAPEIEDISVMPAGVLLESPLQPGTSETPGEVEGDEN